METLDKNQTLLNKYDIIYVLLILLLGYSVCHYLENYMDVLLWDEAIYLDRGFLLWKIVPNTWGPIYSVWYKLLSYLEINKVNLYYLNYKILFLSSSVLVYLFMVVFKAPRLVAFSFTCLWLFHEYNLPSWPKISHFAICIILLAGILSRFVEDNINITIIFSIAFLFGGFARPEIYLSFILTIVILLILIVLSIKHLHKKNYLFLFLLVLCIGITYKFYRTPFTNGDAQRGFGVFLQHFALNYTIWHKQNILWWFEFQDIIEKSFKPPYTLKHLIFNHESLFWTHIFFNLKLFFIRSFSVFINCIVPIFFFKKTLFFIISVLFSGYVLFKSKLNLYSWIRNLKQQKLTLLILLIGTLPSIISSIYAHPRTHYLVMLIPIIAFLYANAFQEKKSNDTKMILFIFFIFYCIGPKAKDFKYFDLYGSTNDMMYKKSIAYLEYKFGNDCTTVFDIDGLLPSLMNGNFTSSNIRPLITEKQVLVSDLILSENPDVIFVTPTLFKLKKTQTDSVFHQLINAPQQFNYKKENLPTMPQVYFLIKSESE